MKLRPFDEFVEKYFGSETVMASTLMLQQGHFISGSSKLCTSHSGYAHYKVLQPAGELSTAPPSRAPIGLLSLWKEAALKT